MTPDTVGLRMEVMVRSVVTTIVGVTLLTTIAVRPPLHLHVAHGGHHHTEGVTHQHHAVVHTHGSAHSRPPLSNAPTDSTDIRRHDHGGVISLDTMVTELPTATKTFGVLEIGSSLLVPDHVVGRHLLIEPRAHPPPGIVSAPNRAPPA